MDDNLGYLFAAFAISWLGIVGYLFYVSQQVLSLQEELREFESDSDAATSDENRSAESKA